jgi:glycosyltransferase involved in cell wall biosynthesis
MPCYNRAYDLINVLRAYDLQTGSDPFELIAVDDGSSDATYEVLTSYQPARYCLRVERMEKNQGPAAARNRGISLASAPLILFVGDDIVPDHNLVRGHLAVHRRYPAREVSILGKVEWGPDFPVNTLMTHIDGIGAQQFSYHYLKDETEYDYRHLYTANVSLKSDLLRGEEKWFDTGFQYAAFEDVELSYRLAKKGMRILYSSNLIGYHYHYHNIWSFSTRQYRAGLMGCVISKKHPELATIVRGKNWDKQNYLWRLAASLYTFPDDYIQWIENEALQLAGYYEWTSQKLLDYFYLQLLAYFLFKGLITGSHQDPKLSQKIVGAYANLTLSPLLIWFIQESARLPDQVSIGNQPALLNKLNSTGSWLTKLYVNQKGQRLLAARRR